MKRNSFRHGIPVAQHADGVCGFHNFHITRMKHRLPPVVAVRIDVFIWPGMGFQSQKYRLPREFGQIGLSCNPLLTVREIGIKALWFRAVQLGPYAIHHAVTGRFIRPVHALRMMERQR